MQDEDVGEGPQAHLHHALLKLLTVGALPRVIGGELGAARSTFTHLPTQRKCTCTYDTNAAAPSGYSPKMLNPHANEAWLNEPLRDRDRLVPCR